MVTDGILGAVQMIIDRFKTSDEINDLESRIDELECDNAELEYDNDDLQYEINYLENKIDELEAEIEEYKNQITALQEENDELNIQTLIYMRIVKTERALIGLFFLRPFRKKKAFYSVTFLKSDTYYI